MAGSDCVNARTIHAHVDLGIGDVTLVQERFKGPIDQLNPESPHHRLQLAMAPKPPGSAACYPDVWGPTRFERIGDLYMLPAHVSSHTRSRCEAHHSLVCRLDPERTASWLGDDFKWTERRLLGGLDIASGEIRTLLHEVVTELRRPGAGGALKIEHLIGQVCVELSRYLRRIDTGRSSGGLPHWRLRLIETAVERNPGAATLTYLAEASGLSVRHLARAFRASTGRSLGAYVSERRIAVARRMLSSGASVKQTAETVGFTAPTNFASAFRRATGYTPRQYRALAGGAAISAKTH